MSDKLIPLRIAGVGYSVPDTVVTNDDLTKLYETSDEWIYSRTGIKERRLVSGEETAIDLGEKAAINAIQKAGMTPDDIDMIIAASTAPIEVYSMGCQIHKRLGITKPIPAFDVAAACTGLIYGLSIAKGMIASGMYKNILIVATDNNSKLLDWTDRGTSILFGDGAGAMVVTQAEDGVDDIIAIDIKSDGNYDHLISLPFDGKNCPLVEQVEVKPSLIKMNGRGVYAFVAKILPKYVEELLNNTGMTADDVDYLIPHQANIRIIQAVQERLGLPENKVVTNIKYYGNTSAASIPIALAEGVEKGNVKLNSTALLCGFGAGMTWGGAIIRLRDGIC
ncbi:MAG: beta-ketoacyl-ACP synthase III [Candidatus Gastranaerophilaceae bacterium]|nr:beta-ketoacyl-ACP synthase III [Candidatus Gastranaerophilaceae bacterium]